MSKLPIEFIGSPYESPHPPWEPPARTRPKARSIWRWGCPCGARFRTQYRMLAHAQLCPLPGTTAPTAAECAAAREHVRKATNKMYNTLLAAGRSALMETCHTILAQCPNEYAKAYAQECVHQINRGADDRTLHVQCLYIRNNLTHWRGKGLGARIRGEIDRFIRATNGA